MNMKPIVIIDYRHPDKTSFAEAAENAKQVTMELLDAADELKTVLADVVNEELDKREKNVKHLRWYKRLWNTIKSIF